MAATGKKSKKPKWVRAQITDIIAEPTAVPTTNSWADSTEDETENYGYGTRTRGPVVLPSASRAARGGLAVDDESIPRRPPYIAYISNLPYDVDESAVTDLFAGLKITNLRLPREGDRLKGFGYVDFEDRESLVGAMNIQDLTISGRRIKIDVSTNDNDRRMGRGRSDRDRDYDPERTMGDWRSGPRAVPEPQSRSRNMDRDGMRDRERDPDPSDSRAGAWREGDRPAPYGGRDSFGRAADDRYGGRDRDRGYGRDGERSGYGGRDGFRTADGFGSRDGSRGFGNRGFGDRDRDPPPREDGKPRERPKLNLLPRTVPRDAEAAPAGRDERRRAPENVFGAAKPVDTAAKEREIEERLRKQEEEARRGMDDKERWGRKNDHSGDRRNTTRRDDRGRDSRSYNRDRRDYSKDDKDRRDYRDDRDRRDYRDDRDRRDYRDDRDKRDYKDERDRRDYRDERDKRDYSKDNQDRREYDRNRRDYSKEDCRDPSKEDISKNSRDNRDDEDTRDNSADRRDLSPEHNEEQNGRPRPSRFRDRTDEDIEKPLPKLKEQEKPNFVASNKFSFLGDADDVLSD